jgi:glyoxylase-like metal-dependent hydrolase (beta-lactamase superfamily II)
MKQIASNIYQIGLGVVNAFIIEDYNGLTLVDTGYKGSAGKIFTALKKAGKNPADIKQIILTHCHPDHTGSAAVLKKELGALLFAHGEDIPLIERGIGGRLPLQLSPGIKHWLIYHIFAKLHGCKIEPVHVDETLRDKSILPIAGGIQVIHTPGHSAGHVSLLLQNEGVLIAGDLCTNMNGLDLSSVYDNRAVGIESILKAAELDFDTAVFGHGKPLIKGANKKLKEKFLPLLKDRKIIG